MKNIKSKNKKDYSSLASKYDGILSSPQYSKYKQKEQEVVISLCEIKSTDTILDIGTGTGEASTNTAKIAKKVIGIDLSSGMIKTAKSKIGKIKNLEFFQMDAEKLDFTGNYFDKIISLSTLHYCPSLETALSEIYRVLKKKGIFCVSFITIPFEYETDMIFSEITKKWPTMKYVEMPRYYKSTKDLKKIIKASNFTIEKFIKLSPAHSIFRLRK